ncbi:hypothetical protein LTR65_008320 [Meristemomyces frigidus]
MIARELFLDYLATAREGQAGVGRLRKDAQNHWNKLTIDQRQRFVAARENVLYAVAARDRARQRADDAANKANTHRTVDRATLQPIDRFQILSPANIPPQKDWLGDGILDVPNVTADKSCNSPNEIVDLIQDCLQYLPSARPTFSSLIKLIEGHLDEGGLEGGGLAYGMRKVGAYGDDDIRDSFQLNHLPADQYKLGFHRDVLPAGRG